MVACVPCVSVSEDFNVVFVYLIQAKDVRSSSHCKENLRSEEKDCSFAVILSIKLQKFLPVPVYIYASYVLA